MKYAQSKIRETKSISILSAALGVIPDDDYPTIVKNVMVIVLH